MLTYNMPPAPRRWATYYQLVKYCDHATTGRIVPTHRATPLHMCNQAYLDALQQMFGD